MLHLSEKRLFMLLITMILVKHWQYEFDGNYLKSLKKNLKNSNFRKIEIPIARSFVLKRNRNKIICEGE